jgi:hypothetical protein
MDMSGLQKLLKAAIEDREVLTAAFWSLTSNEKAFDLEQFLNNRGQKMISV